MTPLVRLENLSIHYGRDTALRNVSLDIEAGEILAIIGESGSGKSTLALALADLLPANAAVSGRIDWRDGQPKPGRDIGFVFQDPASSFDPLMCVGAQLVETIRAHEKIDGKTAKIKAIRLLERVHIPQPEDSFSRYPHQFSGGQKQRIAIALAMAANPPVLIADEPTSALDTIVQKEIVTLLRELVRADGMTLIFITHDIALASNLADRIAVFRDGVLLECGTARVIIGNPQSDYTKALISAVPTLESTHG
ncbi:MAG TPA: ABC transporter ATP-binding protein [Ochrobactrum sp.]|nr:ABC transporter ATP-binding protein [Ochrobactrum sp.]